MLRERFTRRRKDRVCQFLLESKYANMDPATPKIEDNIMLYNNRRKKKSDQKFKMERKKGKKKK
jgi:hypothetical protein